MRVAQEIRKGATSAKTGNLTPAAFNRELSDDTARQVTGMENSSLAKVFAPQQLGQLNAIKNDLGRATFAETAGRGVGSDTVQKLAYTNMLNQSGMPTFLRNFAPTQAIGNVLAQGSQIAYSRANQRLAEQLALALLDPQSAARLVERATPRGRETLAEILRLGGGPAALSLPGITNAQQQ
jgi:hypothetical protein